MTADFKNRFAIKNLILKNLSELKNGFVYCKLFTASTHFVVNMSIKRRAHHFALLFLSSLIYNLIFMSKSIIFVQYVGDSSAAAWWVVIWTVTQLCLSNNTHHNNINIHNHMVWICSLLISFHRCKTLVHIIKHRWTQIIGYSTIVSVYQVGGRGIS